MTDRRTGMPLDGSGEDDKQGQAPQGLAGERTENRGTPHPELRRSIETQAGPLLVEESSGTAFAEASGAMEKHSPDPDADGPVPEGSAPDRSTARDPA
ncbi:hypothetical protein [Sphingomonas sp. M1-B02]|uniref:hypothetical protein n=1 Tax=Sphingomonas sp. M1-B02 TaxID=3114300 RepID=UPI00223FDF58|nr:hypothetical protein [Sphingomonas sp. S6-11]UZK66668.1 hypothetical protein OKW87_02180 [Sphingomonas sp. S6-11]